MKLNEASKTAKRKSFLMLFSLVLILVFAVGGTIAYIVTNTGNVENTFTPGQVACEVLEQTNNGVKSDVKIKNTGNTDAYIRAAIVVTWKDENGNISATQPRRGDSSDDMDYTMNLGLDDWFLGADGYYYYKSPVVPDGNTGILITNCQVSGKAEIPDGYYLSVEILADAIQSVPDTAVNESWPAVKAGNDGTLELNNSASGGGN